MSSDPQSTADFNAWRDEAEAVDLVALVQGRGAKLRRVGGEWVGPCPRCGGTDRFSINPRERVFNCRGFGGGSYIDAVMHIDDCGFLTACETMTGRPAPGKEKRPKKAATPKKAAPEPKREEPPPPEEAVRETPPPSEDSEGRRSRRSARAAADLFEAGAPIIGTHAAAYLQGRGLSVSPSWTGDLRFMQRLAYWGYPDEEAQEQIELGEFPAMLAAIRNAAGEIIGVHRTYLDAAAPRKLVPICPGRNGAKKILGKAGGGLIRLSPPGPALIVGEGIETSRSGYELGIGGDDPAVAAAISLGNLSGGATGTLPHPQKKKRTIYNGEPDPDRPGAILPDGVEEVFILGDGDSDRPATLAQLLTAARRWRESFRVFVSMAPEGLDWNDVLRSQQGAGE